MQLKRHSFLESLVNVFIGYFVALGSQILVFPFVGIHVPLKTNFEIGFYFTIISIIRSYLLRRFFTKITEK